MKNYHEFKSGDRVKTICNCPIKGTIMGYVNNITKLCIVLTDEDFIGYWNEYDLYPLKEKRRCPFCGK